MIAERLERFCNAGAGDVRDISTDDANGAFGEPAQDAGHAMAEITAPLRNARKMRRPDAAGEALSIRGNGEDCVPARIFDTAQQGAGLVAEPPCGGGKANVATKTGFDPTGARFFDHDDQCGPHRKSSIMRWSMPASLKTSPYALKPNPS